VLLGQVRGRCVRAGCTPLTSVCACADATTPALGWQLGSGSIALTVDAVAWLVSAPATVCVAGQAGLLLQGGGAQAVSGTDAFGNYNGTAITWTAPVAGAPRVVGEFRAYPARPSLLTAAISTPDGLNTTGCGASGLNGNIAISLPAWNVSGGLAASLGFMTWATAALGQTPTSLGLSGLPVNNLDVGPIVAFPAGAQSPSTPALVWSSLSSHKVVTHALTQPPQPGPITALWSSDRQDQLVCLSAVCTTDQQPNGNYTVQRVEGWGLLADGAPPPPAESAVGLHRWRVAVSQRAGGVMAADVAPLTFAWSQQAVDNWVGTNSTPPDGSYTFRSGNGFVFADASVVGTIPLQVWRGVNATGHVDWAAVASPAGVAWAQGRGYTLQYVAGWVWAAAPADVTVRWGHGDDSAGVGATAGSYAMGVSSGIPYLPPGWNYSLVWSASYGGPSAAVYEWGADMQQWYGTQRLPSVGLDKIGVYTDDGAWFYCWTSFNMPPRPWPAEVGMQLVVSTLHAAGVPVSYLQLDDWWYQGRFYFGNVRAVANWTADPDPRLFPHGMQPFAESVDLPLQLYTPFWDDSYVSPYNMTPSTVFAGTKLVVPSQSYSFFRDMFALGQQQTGGRFSTYEIDFLVSCDGDGMCGGRGWVWSFVPCFWSAYHRRCHCGAGRVCAHRWWFVGAIAGGWCVCLSL